MDELNLVTLITLGLACYRLTYLIISDVITMPLRSLFVEEIHETDAKGRMTSYTIPKMPFFRATIGTLLTCPWCISVWIGALIVVLWYFFPVATILVSLVFAISGVAGFLLTVTRLWTVNTYSPSKKQLDRMEKFNNEVMGSNNNSGDIEINKKVN